MSDLETMARRLAEQYVRKGYEDGNAKLDEAATHILANTEPETMQGVQWEHEKHHLAGATTPAGHDAVMMWCDEEDTGHIITDLREWRPDQLTPNGKRYELREAGTVKESLIVHPETLTTVEDYEGAPEGTIVASNGKWEVPHMKQNGLWWRSGIACDNEFMARNCHPVLRWGWDA